MSDKIEPALSAAEWNRDEDTLVVVGTGESGERIEADARDTDLYIDVYGGDGFYNRCDVTRPAALIALANAALPDADPRKITREWVRELRTIADTFDSSERRGEKEGAYVETWLFRQIADALESYLPPEPR